MIALQILLSTALCGAPADGPTSAPTTRPSDLLKRQAGRFFTVGARQYRAKDYAGAVRNLLISVRLDPLGAHVPKAREYLARLEREGESQLALARDLIDGAQYLLARDQLKTVAEDFTDLAVGKAAQDELDALRKDPRFVKAEREALARAELRKAERYRQQEQVYLAWEAYGRVVRTWPETPAGRTSRARLAEMQADPAVMAAVERQKADHQLSEWLAMAENYRRGAERFTGAARQRFIGRSRDYYTRILTAYPTSRAAVKARAGLKKLDTLEKPTTTRPAAP